MAIIQLLRNLITGVTPSSLEEGETATNVADRRMWMGNAAKTPVPIVHPDVQIYDKVTYVNGVGNNQPAIGDGGFSKVFASGVLGFLAGPARVGFPTLPPTRGNVMIVDAAGDLAFGPQSTPVNVFVAVPDQGTTENWQEFNAFDWSGTPVSGTNDPTAFEAKAGQTVYITFAATDQFRLWGGPIETEFGGSTGNDLVDNTFLVGGGATTDFATVAEVNAGVRNDAAIAPDAAAATLFRLNAGIANPATNVVGASVSYEATSNVTFAAGGTMQINRDVSLGTLGTGIAIDVPGGTLRGTALRPLVIDEAEIDGGTY
jgi:hypothetical protein